MLGPIWRVGFRVWDGNTLVAAVLRVRVMAIRVIMTSLLVFVFRHIELENRSR